MSPEYRQEQIAQLRRLPEQVRALVSGLTPAQCTTAYVVDEWTIAQNVHHLCDSHMNSYIRCKFMAATDTPRLVPYDQDRWALFPDATAADMNASLTLLEGLHARWVRFWETLPEEAWNRTGIHPESGPVTLKEQLGLYAQHGLDHLDQMERVLAAAGLAK